MILFRTVFAIALILFAGIGCNKHVTSNYPNRSIELIVPWAAGGGTDRVARFIADALQRRLGQPVIVVNRTGGSGAVGHSAGALAEPDGYTLTMGTFELSTMKSMGISKLTWADFTPVAQLNADAAAILVRHDAPWKHLGELLDAIRQQPGKYKMSGTATGGAWDLARSGLLLAANIPPADVIWAPTQGAAPALVELLGGHIDAVACSVPEAASQIDAKQVRVLAVLGPERLAQYPDFSTAREQGINYEAVGWRGILLPKDTPPEIVRALNEKLAEIAASDEFRQFMKKNGFAITVRGTDEFAAFLRDQETKWRDVIKSAGYETLGKNHDPGPNMLPILGVILILIVVVAEGFLSRRRNELLAGRAVPSAPSGAVELPHEDAVRGAVRTPRPTAVFSRDALFLLIALITYIALMPWIGFAASTAIFAFFVMWRLGTRWWVSALASLAVVMAIHLLFVVLFKVQLP